MTPTHLLQRVTKFCRSSRLLVALAGAVAIALIANPEARAFLLIANAVGVDAIGFILLLQARSIWSTVRPTALVAAHVVAAEFHAIFAAFARTVATLRPVGPVAAAGVALLFNQVAWAAWARAASRAASCRAVAGDRA